MEEKRGEIELYNSWFQVADLDGDGTLSGHEAVEFFQRSGLQRNPTLFKIWQLIAGDRPVLTRQEFYTAMKLVSVAQQGQGRLDDADARKVIHGLYGAIDPPKMKGLNEKFLAENDIVHFNEERDKQRKVPSHGILGAVSYDSYPLLTDQEATRCQAAFDQIDMDKDGYVQGVECFQVFMRSGLSKQELKDIWDIVAGSSGALNRHQFIQCQYLINCVKTGLPIPSSLPAGQFPPVGKGHIENLMKNNKDIYSQLKFDALEPKLSFKSSKMDIAFDSQVPDLPSENLEGLTQAEQIKIDSERKILEGQERILRQKEEESAVIESKREFYTRALADLRLAASRTNRAISEAEQRLEMTRKECAQIEESYDKAYFDFSIEHAKIGPLLKTLEEIESEKASLLAKKAALETAIAQLETYDPEWERKERGECETLRLEIIELAARHDSLGKSSKSIQDLRDNMISSIQHLESACKEESSKIKTLEDEFKQWEDTSGNMNDQIIEMMKKIVPMYNSLFNAARDALVPLPPEAIPSIAKPSPSPFKYSPFEFGVYSCSWHTFAEKEYKVVTALPEDARMLTLLSPSIKDVEMAQRDVLPDESEANCDIELPTTALSGDNSARTNSPALEVSVEDLSAELSEEVDIIASSEPKNVESTDEQKSLEDCTA